MKKKLSMLVPPGSVCEPSIKGTLPLLKTQAMAGKNRSSFLPYLPVAVF